MSTTSDEPMSGLVTNLAGLLVLTNKMYKLQAITGAQRGVLKDHILACNGQLLAAFKAFVDDNEKEALVEKLVYFLQANPASASSGGGGGGGGGGGAGAPAFAAAAQTQTTNGVRGGSGDGGDDEEEYELMRRAMEQNMLDGRYCWLVLIVMIRYT
jgi:hypothetical protein